MEFEKFEEIKAVGYRYTNSVLDTVPGDLSNELVGFSKVFFLCVCVRTFHNIFILDTTFYLWLHRYQWKKVSKKTLERVFVNKTTAEGLFSILNSLFTGLIQN